MANGSEFQTHYALLGVAENAEAKLIRSRYLDAVKLVSRSCDMLHLCGVECAAEERARRRRGLLPGLSTYLPIESKCFWSRRGKADNDPRSTTQTRRSKLPASDRAPVMALLLLLPLLT